MFQGAKYTHSHIYANRNMLRYNICYIMLQQQQQKLG